MSARYRIVQTGRDGDRAYLCAWVVGEEWVYEGVHDCPVILYDQHAALTFDEATAREIARRLDARYRGVVRHEIEAV